MPAKRTLLLLPCLALAGLLLLGLRHPGPGASPGPGAEAVQRPLEPAGDRLDETPLEELARRLELGPEETERVGQALRAETDALDEEMARMMEQSGYDDARARAIGEAHERRVVERVAEALPEGRRTAFRALLGGRS